MLCVPGDHIIACSHYLYPVTDRSFPVSRYAHHNESASVDEAEAEAEVEVEVTLLIAKAIIGGKKWEIRRVVSLV